MADGRFARFLEHPGLLGRRQRYPDRLSAMAAYAGLFTDAWLHREKRTRMRRLARPGARSGEVGVSSRSRRVGLNQRPAAAPVEGCGSSGSWGTDWCGPSSSFKTDERSDSYLCCANGAGNVQVEGLLVLCWRSLRSPFRQGERLRWSGGTTVAVGFAPASSGPLSSLTEGFLNARVESSAKRQPLAHDRWRPRYWERFEFESRW
jgi:hypothetical protein